MLLYNKICGTYTKLKQQSKFYMPVYCFIFIFKSNVLRVFMFTFNKICAKNQTSQSSIKQKLKILLDYYLVLIIQAPRTTTNEA